MFVSVLNVYIHLVQFDPTNLPKGDTYKYRYKASTQGIHTVPILKQVNDLEITILSFPEEIKMTMNVLVLLDTNGMSHLTNVSVCLRNHVLMVPTTLMLLPGIDMAWGI